MKFKLFCQMRSFCITLACLAGVSAFGLLVAAFGALVEPEPGQWEKWQEWKDEARETDWKTRMDVVWRIRNDRARTLATSYRLIYRSDIRRLICAGLICLIVAVTAGVAASYTS
jgi:hypothetical protein